MGEVPMTVQLVTDAGTKHEHSEVIHIHQVGGRTFELEKEKDPRFLHRSRVRINDVVAVNVLSLD